MHSSPSLLPRGRKSSTSAKQPVPALNPKSLARTSLSIVITGSFLYLAFRDADFPGLWQTMLRADLFWASTLILVGLLSHWVRAVRWRYLLAPMKDGIRVRNLFSAVMIGYAVNNILPRVGELVRPAVIGRLEGIAGSSALGTVIIERVLDFLTFSFMVGVTLSMYPSAIDPFVDDPASMQPLFIAGSVGATALFILLFLRLEWFVGFVDRLSSRIPGRFSKKVGSFLRSFRAGLNISHLRHVWGWVVGWSLLMWGLYALGLYLSFFLFGEVESMNLGFGAAAVLLVVTTIAFALPAPGAMGTYHSFLPAALTGLYGVAATPALGLTIITHELQFVVIILVGAAFYLTDYRKIGSLRAPDTTMGGTAP